MSFLNLWIYVFDQIWEIYGHHLFKYFYVSIIPSLPSWNLMKYMPVLLTLSHRALSVDLFSVFILGKISLLFPSSLFCCGAHQVNFLFHILCFFKISTWFLFIAFISLMIMPIFSFISNIFYMPHGA